MGKDFDPWAQRKENCYKEVKDYMTRCKMEANRYSLAFTMLNHYIIYFSTYISINNILISL